MGSVSFCIMCLATKVKLYPMNFSMLSIYNELIFTRYKVSLERMYACYECAHMLHKYEVFKAKCCKAYDILWSVSPGTFELTEEDLKGIDRKENKLESLLTICTSTADFQPKQKRLSSVRKFKTQKVKRESSLNSVEEEDNPNFHLKKKLTLPVDSTTLYDYDQSELYSECKSSVKSTSEQASEHDIEDDHVFVDLYEAESSNCNSDEKSSIGLVEEISKKDLHTESYESNDNKVDLASPMKLDVGYDNSNDNSINIDKYPVADNVINNKRKASKIKKRKCQTKNIHIVPKKKKITRNNSIEDLTENLELFSEEDEPIVKRNANNQIQYNEDRRFTLDSSIFRDHVTVIKLTPEDARRELLLRKESKNYKMNPNKCNLCYKGFISEATYTAHMKKHSLDYGTVKCDVCQMNFIGIRYLRRHWSLCHSRKWLCKTCPYKCYNINQAKSHVESHQGKKYTCKLCEEVFRFPNTLSSHMRIKHSSELVCEFCGSTFGSASGMDCHIRLSHRTEKNEHLGPKCEECDVHFASERAWKRHLVLCSRHEVSNGCGICGESFPDRAELRIHTREHSDTRPTTHTRARNMIDYTPHTCEYCKKTMLSRKAYVKHMKSEHPQIEIDKKLIHKYVCEVCGTTFKHPSSLVTHQRKHSGEKPFGCPQCDKKFKSAYAVKMHIPVHTNDYMFKCHLCEKAFGDKSRLNRHLKGHLNIRPFKCSYCEKTFMFQCEERLHTKYVHCKEPYPKRDRSKRYIVKKENLK